jgi:hypothetical protein
MKTLKGKASEILYDMMEGRYTKEIGADGEYFLIETETGTEFAVEGDVKYYLNLMEDYD